MFYIHDLHSILITHGTLTYRVMRVNVKEVDLV